MITKLKYVNANFVLYALLFSFLSSSCAEEFEKVSEEKPYSVLITKERSYYQAIKVKERLIGFDLEAYLVATTDSIDREWFNILSGAFVDSSSTLNYKNEIDSLYQLSKTEIIDVRTLVDTFTVLSKKNEHLFSNSEKRRIIANKPSIPEHVNEVISKFPDNNSFFLNRINILNLTNSRSIPAVNNVAKLDMPRGVTLGNLSKYCNSICEVQYQDNLFDDRVTISIMKIKPDIEWNSDLIFEKYSTEKTLTYPKSNSFSLEHSYKILNTGTYENEKIDPIEINAFETLVGYKVGLTTKSGVYRTYFVLTDTNLEYLIIAQSIEKTEEEMKLILSEVGKSNGVNVYDEFYNTFYVLPDEENDQDIFLGYSIDKLGWSYAEQKGYSNWSRAMVGHWVAKGFFWNSKFGNWNFSLFDLLTEDSQGYIYGNLYSGHNYSKPVDVFGVTGFFIERNIWFYSVHELNFGVDRFVVAIDYKNIGKSESLKRAEKFQLINEKLKKRNKVL